MADKESDKLLDKLNEPGGSSSSSSYSSGEAKGSGLSVIERKAMPKPTVKDNRGNDVVIWGQTRSSSTTAGHDRAIIAVLLAPLGTRDAGVLHGIEPAIAGSADCDRDRDRALGANARRAPE